MAASYAWLSREPALPEASLDRLVEVVRHVLRDAPRAVAPHPCHPEQVGLADAGVDHDAEGVEDRQILLADRLVAIGRAEAERDVEPLDRFEREADPLADLRVSQRGAGIPPTGGLEVSEREVSGVEGTPEGIGADAHRLQIRHDPRPHDVPPGEGAVVRRLEEADVDEPADALERSSAARRQLRLGQAVAVGAGSAMKTTWQTSEQNQ